jgi:hypothetical protein
MKGIAPQLRFAKTDWDKTAESRFDEADRR